MSGVEGYIAKKLMSKGIRYAEDYFSSEIADSGPKFGDSEYEYVNQCLNVLVEVQALYRLYIKETSNPRIEEFKESIKPISLEAMELRIVGEAKSYNTEDSDNEADDILDAVFVRINRLSFGLVEVLECDEVSEIEDIFENQIDMSYGYIGSLFESTEQIEQSSNSQQSG